MIVVGRSKVPIGNADKIETKIQDTFDAYGIAIKFDKVFNPEFLKEGVSLYGFMKSNCVVIGTDNEYVKKN
ncbi:hypothetical protein [Algibacter pacificus]|uniref:hypothetical protein n=1 Tax=Algibacter pacificus TaxID=2599389 RepID=UPI0011C7FC1C|nr:hypothetical protein [Algibacter pacificus]